ncbi:PAS domain S-box protein [Anabaena sp. UHCC 0253]|uniref:ATP-binding protein n=1 Tax=Anabaena sp. UHCC 0253 TaxID=2590019 RepID=UPI001444D95E|nr:ATP-binding protein [Anabaena sp. UHCC 0253]MTJ53574.1 PAS domain S-box protein [Anabaena sp. UHCC 0253]
MVVTNYSILFLEDSLVDRLLYTQFLSKDKLATYQIIEAKSGLEGLTKLETNQPDLILLDYQLQDMNGLEFLHQLQLQFGNLQIPVIILTGTGDEKIAVQAMKLGVQDYIVKDKITPEGLCRTIHAVLEKTRLIQNIQMQEQQQKLLAAIALRIHQFIHLEDILPVAVQGVREFLKADRVVIYKFCPEMNGEIVAESVLPEWTPFLGKQIQESCFWENQTAYHRGKIRAIADIYNAGFTPCHINLLEQFQVKANLVMPIRLKYQHTKTEDDCQVEELADQSAADASSHTLWGLLIAHQCSTTRQWETHELDLLQQLSVQLAVAIQQAELYQNLQNLNVSLEQKVQKRTHQLAASERKYRAIFNQKFQFTGLLSIEGNVLELNQASLEFTGLEFADLVNRPMWEIYCWQNSQETQEQLKQAIARAAQGEFISYEVDVLGPDHQILTLDFSLRPLKNDAGEVVMLIPEGRDITQAKLNETKRKQAESILKFQAQILEEIHDAVITMDINGIIQSWNFGAEKYYGYTATEMIGQNITIVYTDPVYPIQLYTDIIAPLLAKGRHEIEVMPCRSKSGEIIYVNLRLSVMRDEHGKIICLIGCSHDISKQQAALIERNHLLEQEKAARKHAETANRIKDEFLAILSHELRTPLNSILGWSSLLGKGKLDPAKTAEAISIIERNANLQVNLIDDLLEMSRILRGKGILNISTVNLATTISAVEEILNLAAQSKEIQIQTMIEPNIGLVAGDPVRLQQIVWNLLSNAVKFTSQGGRIEIRLERIDSDAQITVSDTGKGINPTFLPHIFDYFRQEDSSTTREFGGLGLGLAIVRNLAELHGGTIKADSPGLGQGATFTVRLPLMTTSSEIAPDNHQQDISSDLSNIKVLVVDDDADLLHLVAFVLKMYNAEVFTASSSLTALEMLRHIKPDILISDIGMPPNEWL